MDIHSTPAITIYIQSNWEYDKTMSFLLYKDMKTKTYGYIKKKMWWIANEKTYHKRLNDTQIINYRSPYGLK